MAMLMKRFKYAKKLVREGLQRPFLRLISADTYAGVSTTFFDGTKKIYLSKKSGYYTIYRKKRSDWQCLYVGKSNSDLHKRINRWAKGIAGKLRPDENHSAAEKARRDGVRLTDELYIKYITKEEADVLIDDEDIRCEPLDEWIAPLLKSKYNRRTFNTGLEAFFE